MDEREHVTDGGSCWCDPVVEFVDGGYIVTHAWEQLP